MYYFSCHKEGGRPVFLFKGSSGSHGVSMCWLENAFPGMQAVLVPRQWLWAATFPAHPDAEVSQGQRWTTGSPQSCFLKHELGAMCKNHFYLKLSSRKTSKNCWGESWENPTTPSNLLWFHSSHGFIPLHSKTRRHVFLVNWHDCVTVTADFITIFSSPLQWTFCYRLSDFGYKLGVTLVIMGCNC